MRSRARLMARRFSTFKEVKERTSVRKKERKEEKKRKKDRTIET